MNPDMKRCFDRKFDHALAPKQWSFRFYRYIPSTFALSISEHLAIARDVVEAPW